MCYNILFGCQEKNNAFQEGKKVFAIKFFVILTFFSFLCLSAAASAEDILYTGDGAGLQAAPGSSGAGFSLFPGSNINPLFSGNTVVIDYDPSVSGMINPEEVYGGYSHQGNVTDNKVVFLSGAVVYDIYGGRTEDGNATNNTVSINNGDIGHHVYGGYSEEGNAANNAVTVANSYTGIVYGGYGLSDNGMKDNVSAINNTVSITNSDVYDVYGGYSRTSDGNCDASYNTVNFNGGSVQRIYGGYSTSGSGSAGTEYNTVNFSGGSAGEIFGATSSNYSGGSSSAKNNTVNISSGSVDGDVYGAQNADGNALNNTVNISGGSVGGNVYGATSKGHDRNGALNNTVNISGGSVGGDVYGGFNEYDGSSSGNTVNISGGRLDSSVYGGYSYEGVASNNMVNINGGLVGGDVYGGFADGWSIASAISNSVTVSAPADLSSSYIYGGYVTGPGRTDAFTGNTFNLQSAGITAVGIANFEYYNFYLPADAAANDTMLTVTDTVDLADTTAKVFLQGNTSLQTGDKVSLINSAGGIGGSPLNNSSQAYLGAFLLYDFSIYTDSDNLWAELASARTTPQSKILTNSRLAPLAFLNQGADLASSLEYLEVSGDKRFTTFAATAGGSSTYDTGSEIDVDGASFLAGVMWDARVSKNSLTMSAFIEVGWGNYDAFNSFGGNAVKGSGDMDYYGGGLLARYRWDSGLYAEASLRLGRVTTDFDSGSLSPSGTKTSYDSGSSYYGAHAGLGYRWGLSDKTSLEVSGKYLWTRLDSDEFTLPTGDHINFDSANSSRWRTGFRFYHNYKNANLITLYYGAAYEYEFDGDANGRLYGAYGLDKSSLSGGTGIGELGLILRQAFDGRLSAQIGVQGYVGVREGISGVLRLEYVF